MSSNNGERLIGERDARRKAEEVVAFDIGNIPRLGDVQVTETEYVFPLEIRLPRVIFDEERKRPVEVKFMSSETIGEIHVDAVTGEVERPHLNQIEANIRRERRVVEDAVQKALVRSSAARFSQLPFPEHRYTPILDILSHLILEGPITDEEFDAFNAVSEQKYLDYVEMLEEVDLVRTMGDSIEADNVLIELRANETKPPKLLNAALAHFFEAGADNISTIREILGPHLILSAFYYENAILGEGDPQMAEEEFEEVLERHYYGNDLVEKRFKLSRYLIQLEDVGLLESSADVERPTWSGKEKVRKNLLRQGEMLDPIAEIIA